MFGFMFGLLAFTWPGMTIVSASAWLMFEFRIVSFHDMRGPSPVAPYETPPRGMPDRDCSSNVSW